MSEANPISALQKYVAGAVSIRPLAARIESVMSRLPAAVIADFVEDPLFRLAVDDLVPGQGRTVWMACPTSANGSRCVILKPLLATCPEDFAHYIIAHELAHAFLRNGGWGDHLDPEIAADALATEWGFSRPPPATAKTVA
jgi:hypothetical protein